MSQEEHLRLELYNNNSAAIASFPSLAFIGDLPVGRHLPTPTFGLSASAAVEPIATLACCRRWQLHSLPFTILACRCEWWSLPLPPYSHYPRCATTTAQTETHRRQQRPGPSAARKCAAVYKLTLTWGILLMRSWCSFHQHYHSLGTDSHQLLTGASPAVQSRGG